MDLKLKIFSIYFWQTEKNSSKWIIDVWLVYFKVDWELKTNPQLWANNSKALKFKPVQEQTLSDKNNFDLFNEP